VCGAPCVGMKILNIPTVTHSKATCNCAASSASQLGKTYLHLVTLSCSADHKPRPVTSQKPSQSILMLPFHHSAVHMHGLAQYGAARLCG
jgi:hypothetical protein